jgi:hypothetical protein
LAADDRMVLAAHGQLAAGNCSRSPEVPVIVGRGRSEQQKHAYVIANNRLTERDRLR